MQLQPQQAQAVAVPVITVNATPAGVTTVITRQGLSASVKLNFGPAATEPLRLSATGEPGASVRSPIIIEELDELGDEIEDEPPQTTFGVSTAKLLRRNGDLQDYVHRVFPSLETSRNHGVARLPKS